MESLTQGWRALSANLVPWVVGLLIYLLVTVGLTLLVVMPIALQDTPGEEDSVALSPATVAALILVYTVLFVLGVIWTLNLYRNAVRQVQGEHVRVRDFFRVDGLGIPFVAYLLMTVLTIAGLLLFIVPGIVVAVFLMYVPYLVFSRPEAGIVAVFRGSVDIVRNNPGATLLLVLFSLLLGAVGSLTVIGVFITTPLAACLLAHATLKGSGDRYAYGAEDRAASARPGE
ncbi:hypothetical protein GCM10027595_11880 [Corynebacterium nasicanis]